MDRLKFEKYLIFYNVDEHFYTTNAVSFKSCIIQFLDYTGDNKPLIRKALNGMETEKDMVELINAMTNNYILRVYKIDKAIYDPSAEDEQ